MKKFVLLFLTTFVLCTAAYGAESEEISYKDIIEIQNKIDNIGFKILNSNGIETRAVFDFNIKRVKNAGTSFKNRQITVYRTLYERLASDDEIAAVLSHEIAHSTESYNGIFNGYFCKLSYAFAPRKYEYKADKLAVDYMVNAGYNPVAIIVTLNKTEPQRRYDWYSTHPLTSRRMMEVYEYIYKKYPEYLANNKYKDNIFYQNFLLTSKENRDKFQKKVKSGSKRFVHYN